MFEDLNWKYAARRAAVVIAIYLGLLYVLSIALPESGFRLETREQILSLLVNAVMFFLIFTLVYALVDRSRRRRLGETTQRSKPGKPTGEAEGPSGPLKGRPNPNTSRKKARRKR
jgi:4-hydroxybenzoate polyprenyltransferase